MVAANIHHINHNVVPKAITAEINTGCMSAFGVILRLQMFSSRVFCWADSWWFPESLSVQVSQSYLTIGSGNSEVS